MRCMTLARALVVRIAFAGHGFIAIWRLFMVTGKLWTWYLGAALIGLLMETLITLARNSGKEWKWFCPSVFFYLLSVVPAIWFLELHEMEARIKDKESAQLNNSITAPIFNMTEEQLSLDVAELGLQISIPLALSADLWLRVLEQFLLLMLIVGRWVLPKGAISHDQLSQLLLVYVGTAADIVEFYEAFSEDEVKYNRLLCYIILGIWSLSLFQFCLVLTAARARRDQCGIPSSQEYEGPIKCCNPELYGILTSIMLQDGPFLCIRLMLIFKYHVVSYTNMFFTSKNSLVIILLIYRLIVIHTTAKSDKWEEKILSPAFRDAYPRSGPRNGRKMNKNLSSSTPNVFDIHSATLKNGQLNGKGGLPRYMLHNDMGTNSLKAYRTNNNGQSHRLDLPVEKITDKTGGSVGCIKSI